MHVFSVDYASVFWIYIKTQNFCTHRTFAVTVNRSDYDENIR
uniref:Uncharacterized protein n=1 Tax=Anguilla anguilla TaxID=7936 RepID=A0A0E9UFL4_ANGAN